jgi:DNA-binding transcriptional LysR family regulator
VELRHLRYFCAVAEHQGFRQASRHLRVAQTAISKTIRNLEEELDVILLVRNQRSMRLTPEGLIFLEEAKRTLVQAETAVLAAQRAARGEVGTLSIGFIGSATCTFLPRIFREYRLQCPGVRLLLHEMTPARQQEALTNGDIDLGFTRLPLTEGANFDTEVIYSDPLLAVLPEGHREEEHDPVGIRDLAQDPFIIFQRTGAPSLFDAILALCAQEGFSPRIISQPDLMQTALSLVEAGEGVALVPACVRHLRSSGIVFRRVVPDSVRIALAMVWPTARPTVTLRFFIDILRKHLPSIRKIVAVDGVDK